MSESRTMAWVILGFTALMIFASILTSGTADEGDSIFHFLYSKYAFRHPENFLNQWAKPVFVLLTAPVAQFGFIALKIFNALLLGGSLWFTYLSTRKLLIPSPWIAPVALMLMPMNLSHTLSGLTEPMFAFWLIVGIYGLISQKTVSALLWLSFLPFVRSEGLVVFCVLLLFLMSKRQWKYLPLLAVGHVAYSIVGYFFYQDFLWVFNKMNYATLQSVYGSGPWWHFARHLPEVIGYFLCILLIVGLLAGAIRLILHIFGKDKTFSKEELWLIYGMFLAYFIAHSLFWYLGIFNSFGLIRVMVGILPVTAILIARGVDGLMKRIPFLKKMSPLWIQGILIFGMLVSLILEVNWQKDFSLKADQKTQFRAAEKYAGKYTGYTWYFDAIYPALCFEVDWFDPMEHRRTPGLFTGEPIPTKSVILWDDWFSVVEAKIPLDKLSNDQRFRQIETFTETEGDRQRVSVLFEYDSSFDASNVLYFNDFESDPSLQMLDSSVVFSGKYSARISKEHPYSPGFNGMLNSLSGKPGSKIRLSFQAYFEEAPEQGPGVANAVISFENMEKSYQWQGTLIYPKVEKPGVWRQIVIEQAVHPLKTFDDRVKAYIWNDGAQHLYIDDLRVEWVE